MCSDFPVINDTNPELLLEFFDIMDSLDWSESTSNQCKGLLLKISLIAKGLQEATVMHQVRNHHLQGLSFTEIRKVSDLQKCIPMAWINKVNQEYHVLHDHIIATLLHYEE